MTPVVMMMMIMMMTPLLLMMMMMTSIVSMVDVFDVVYEVVVLGDSPPQGHELLPDAPIEAHKTTKCQHVSQKKRQNGRNAIKENHKQTK